MEVRRQFIEIISAKFLLKKIQPHLIFLPNNLLSEKGAFPIAASDIYKPVRLVCISESHRNFWIKHDNRNMQWEVQVQIFRPVTDIK